VASGFNKGMIIPPVEISIGFAGSVEFIARHGQLRTAREYCNVGPAPRPCVSIRPNAVTVALHTIGVGTADLVSRGPGTGSEQAQRDLDEARLQLSPSCFPQPPVVLEAPQFVPQRHGPDQERPDQNRGQGADEIGQAAELEVPPRPHAALRPNTLS